MLVLYQNCNASQTLRSNLIINRVKLNYETSVYIAIACEGFSFRQEYVQDCSVFMVGFFYILSRICLHLWLKNECSSQIGMPLKVLHAQKDKECLCTFCKCIFLNASKFARWVRSLNIIITFFAPSQLTLDLCKVVLKRCSQCDICVPKWYVYRGFR